jgi:hypothetical protein
MFYSLFQIPDFPLFPSLFQIASAKILFILDPNLTIRKVDAGNLVYLVAVIVYFIYTALKKNKSEEEFEQPSQSEKPESKKKPVSFEELLKEIRQGQQQPEEEINQPEPSRRQTQMPQDRESRPFEKPKRQTPKPLDKPKEYYTYEGVVEERAAPERVKLADQERLSSHISGIKSSILQERDKAEVHENRYKVLLSNPKTAKDAIILSEVLARRHF